MAEYMTLESQEYTLSDQEEEIENEYGEGTEVSESKIQLRKGPKKVPTVQISEFTSQPSFPRLRTESSKNVSTYYERTPNDTHDPSYTNLTLPYSVVCGQRYRQAAAKQRKQFIKELQCHQLLQKKAIDGVRIRREFCNPVPVPPKQEELIKLTVKQKAKIEEILSREFDE